MPGSVPDPMTGLGQRLDKWLWHARLTRTRSLAERLVEGGKVRVNRARVTKPGRTVRAGDVVTAAVNGRVRVLKIVAIAERRGPAAVAQALYEDLSPAAATAPDPARSDARPPGAGRPTKRERRRLEAWLGGDED